MTPRASQSCTGMQSQGPHTLTSPCQSPHSWPVCWSATEFQQRSRDDTCKEICLSYIATLVWCTCYVLHSISILYHAPVNLDYLSKYFSILCIVSNNRNVGMGHNSQCIHFAISTRIHSLVIHSVAVKLKRQLYIFKMPNVFIL